MASFFCHVVGGAKRVRLERTVRPHYVLGKSVARRFPVPTRLPSLSLVTFVFGSYSPTRFPRRSFPIIFPVTSTAILPITLPSRSLRTCSVIHFPLWKPILFALVSGAK